MKRIISFKFAANASLILYTIFIFFHLSVIVGIQFFDFIPIDYLWGGRMETKEQLLVFEIISVLIMILCLFFTLLKAQYIKMQKLLIVAHIIMWFLFVLFTVNTIGNILAKTNFEKLFGIITAALAFFTLRLALEINNKQ